LRARGGHQELAHVLARFRRRSQLFTRQRCSHLHHLVGPERDLVDVDLGGRDAHQLSDNPDGQLARHGMNEVDWLPGDDPGDQLARALPDRGLESPDGVWRESRRQRATHLAVSRRIEGGNRLAPGAAGQ
jgi:hypothetical protein